MERGHSNNVIRPHVMDSEEVTVTCHENHVPPFVEKEMERLYESIYSSPKYFRVFHSLENLSTYEVRRNGISIAILLFLRERRQVTVLNEVMRIDDMEIARFVDYIFSRFKAVSLISFRAIETRMQWLHFPCQSYNCCEDVVVSLPSSVAEYVANLGSATRKTIKKYLSRMQRDFPSYEVRVFTNEKIELFTIQEIFGLKKARMRSKNEAFAICDEKIEQIFNLAKICGLVNVILIDGRMCAGSISYRVGAHYFLQINTHDPDYNDYRLGTLSCFVTICECISRNACACHLLWGRSDYKFRLLGVQRDLENLTVYRSKTSLLLHCNRALDLSLQHNVRRIKIWLREKVHQKNSLALIAMRCKNWAQNKQGQV